MFWLLLSCVLSLDWVNNGHKNKIEKVESWETSYNFTLQSFTDSCVYRTDHFHLHFGFIWHFLSKQRLIYLFNFSAKSPLYKSAKSFLQSYHFWSIRTPLVLPYNVHDLKKPRIYMKNKMKVAMRTFKSNIFNSAKKSGKTWAVIKSPVKSKKSLAILGTSLVVTGGGVVLWNNYYMPL